MGTSLTPRKKIITLFASFPILLGLTALLVFFVVNDDRPEHVAQVRVSINASGTVYHGLKHVKTNQEVFLGLFSHLIQLGSVLISLVYRYPLCKRTTIWATAGSSTARCC